MSKRGKRPEGPAHFFARALVKVARPTGVTSLGQGLTAAGAMGVGAKRQAGESMRHSLMGRQITDKMDPYAYAGSADQQSSNGDGPGRGARNDDNGTARGRGGSEGYATNDYDRVSGDLPRRSLSANRSTHNLPSAGLSLSPEAYQAMQAARNNGQGPRRPPPSSDPRVKPRRLSSIERLAGGNPR